MSSSILSCRWVSGCWLAERAMWWRRANSCQFHLATRLRLHARLGVESGGRATSGTCGCHSGNRGLRGGRESQAAATTSSPSSVH